MKNTVQNDLFDDRDGRLRGAVYGFCIFVIVLCHWGILEIGYFGVDIFILLSGYYLTNRYYKEKPVPILFYAKRFSRIYPSYWIILLFYLFFYVRQQQSMDFWYICLNVSGYSNRFMFEQNSLVPGSWFLALIVSLYIIYPFVIKFFSSFQIKFIPLALLSATVLLSQYILLPESVLIITLRVPLFFLGMFFSISNQTQSRFIVMLKKDRWILPVSALFCLFLFQLSSMWIPYRIRWETGLLWWSSVFFAPVFVIPLFRFMAAIDSKYLYPFKIMGICSLEIYLFHEPIMHVISSFIDQNLKVPHRWSLSIILSLLIVTLISYFLRKSLNYLFAAKLFSRLFSLQPN